jgi:hypothetical protein
MLGATHVHNTKQAVRRHGREHHLQALLQRTLIWYLMYRTLLWHPILVGQWIRHDLIWR